MSMLDHDYMLSFFGKIYDLSKGSSEFRKKLKIRDTDWSSNGDQTIKTAFGLIVFNLYLQNKKLQITLNGVRVFDENAQHIDYCLKTRSEKETNLILKQIEFFESVYNEHLDGQLEELGSGVVEEEEKEETLNLALNSENLPSAKQANATCLKLINEDFNSKWICFLLTTGFISIVCGGMISMSLISLLFSLGCFLGLNSLNFLLWAQLHTTEKKKIKATFKKCKKDSHKMIEEPKVDEMSVKSKELDEKNDELDEIIEKLDKL